MFTSFARIKRDERKTECERRAERDKKRFRPDLIFFVIFSGRRSIVSAVIRTAAFSDRRVGQIVNSIRADYGGDQRGHQAEPAERFDERTAAAVQLSRSTSERCFTLTIISSNNTRASSKLPDLCGCSLNFIFISHSDFQFSMNYQKEVFLKILLKLNIAKLKITEYTAAGSPMPIAKYKFESSFFSPVSVRISIHGITKKKHCKVFSDGSRNRKQKYSSRNIT